MRCTVSVMALLASVSLPTGLAWAEGTIGTSNVAPIEPNTVPVPDSTPCSVPLFNGTVFGGDAVSFSYAPPASCPGPWAKIVLQTDISVTAGRQFDRTATIFIGGVPVLFGTTAEPRATLAPSWHVERDLTDDTALLRTAQTGRAQIANYQTSVYTSAITGTARLLFYPATRRYPVPRTPDLVVPLNTDPSMGPTMLNTGTATLSRTLSFPGTVEQAHLDVYLQSQSNDEFWYTCVPDALATPLETCGGGAFREGLVTIDAQRAGVAPVYPWIYTGGIDPYLWEPTPGVQTLNFGPARVELTPFAGLLDDTKPHQVAVAVRGANTGFSVAGALYLTLDREATSPLRGTLLRNTLGETTPVVSNSITASGGTETGAVDTSATHDYVISGRLQTSHGPVTTTVSQQGSFANRQNFDVDNTLDDQAIVQRTDTLTTVSTTDATGTGVVARVSSYPLEVHYRYAQAADGTAKQTTVVTQGLRSGEIALRNGVPTALSAVIETVSPNDTLALNADGSLLSHTGSGTASYLAGTLGGSCVVRRSTNTNSVLTTQTQNNCDVLRSLNDVPGFGSLLSRVR